MTRKWGVMAGLVMLAACGDKGESPAQQAPAAAPAKTMGAQSFGIITATCSTAPVSEVTMTLNSVFGGLDSDGKIARNIKQGSKDVPNIDPIKLNVDTWPTDLDFDSSTLGAGPVKVTIVLSSGKTAKKPGLHFLRPRLANLPSGPDPAGTDSSLAVLVPSPVTDFCGREAIVVNTAANTESVSFVMNRVKGSRSLNIGLLVPGAKNGADPQLWLPIFLDPNVRNEG